MATINLGRIKPVFKGAYASGTAYVVDDIVVYSDESYICIQAGTGQTPSSATAYWTKIAAKGTNGDTFNLANKEIAFKTNAGALDGIPIGTAGQALKVNSGATGYEFGAVAGGKVLQVVQTEKSDTGSWGASATTRQATGLTASITPSATTSKILVQYQVNIGHPSSGGSQYFMHLFRDSTEINVGDAAGSRKRATNAWGGNYSSNQHEYMTHTFTGMYLDSPSSTSAIAYSLRHTDATGSGTYYINRSSRDNNAGGYDPRFVSNIILTEIGA